MNTSKLFKNSHRLVRETFKKYGKAHYQTTFGAAIKAIIGGYFTRERNATFKKSSTARQPAVTGPIEMAKNVAYLTQGGAVGMRTALSRLGYSDNLMKNESFKRQVSLELLALA